MPSAVRARVRHAAGEAGTFLPGGERAAVSARRILAADIALIAASGLTNKQIAGQLFLSPRTVGDHLHKIFPKLGITTRAALRDALDSEVRSHSR